MAANILVVHPSVPAKSVRELIALAKLKPGALNYGAGGSGTTPHLAAELFKAMAGANIVRVSYRGTGPTLTALLAGEVQLTFGTAATLMPHIKSGKLRAMAVTSAQPSALAPELPTISDSGLPGYEAGSIYGLFAPAKTPAAIVRRLNLEVVRVVSQTSVKDRFFRAGAEAVGNSPEQFASVIKSEMSRLGKVIKDAGIRGE